MVEVIATVIDLDTVSICPPDESVYASSSSAFEAGESIVMVYPTDDQRVTDHDDRA